MIIFSLGFYNPNVNTFMFIRVEITQKAYIRKSKSGLTHPYIRKKQIAVFNCDQCSKEFKREKGVVDPRRLSNNYFHVCPKCDPKRFAQKKGVERRFIWDTPASSDVEISKV
jgi:hypothetical protein